MESPDAPKQIKALVDAMEDEKRRRSDFREWLTPHIKAEFINGEVIIHSPVKRRHWKITDLLSRLMSIYADDKDLGSVGTEKVMIGLERNDYEPDVVFFLAEKEAQFSDEQVLFPAPDLVVEILSKKTAAIDRGVKKIDYAANGIAEYWIVDPVRRQIEQYLLFSPEKQEYDSPKIFHFSDIIESRAIPGFIIPVSAVFDKKANMKAIKTFMKS